MSEPFDNPFPKIVVIAGPNGAGKSTSAARLMLGALKVHEFVNADTIAQGLSAFDQQRVAFEAGRVMLTRLKDLARSRASFGFETTLATRWYAGWFRQLRSEGYRLHLIYLWLRSPEQAVARVAERVRTGGHDVPEDVIRRRYESGLQNFFDLYLPLADSWQLIDNSAVRASRRIAAGASHGLIKIDDPVSWALVQRKVQQS